MARSTLVNLLVIGFAWTPWNWFQEILAHCSSPDKRWAVPLARPGLESDFYSQPGQAGWCSQLLTPNLKAWQHTPTFAFSGWRAPIIAPAVKPDPAMALPRRWWPP